MSVFMGIVSGSILALSLFFCWYRWIYTRAYKQFPSQRMDTKWLPRIITGRYRKDVPLTSIFFSELVRSTRQFQEEGICVLWFIKPYLLVFKEEFSKTLFNEEAVSYKSHMFNLSREIFGNGILGREGEAWKFHRRLLDPAFSLGILKGKLPIYNENGKELVQGLRALEGQPTESLVRILKTTSFNVMTESVLGFRMDSEKYASKAQVFIKMLVRGTRLSFQRMSLPWLQINALLKLFPLGRQYLAAVGEIHRFVHEILEDLRNSASLAGELQLDGERDVRKSTAQVLLEQHLKNPTFTMEELRDHLGNIMIAGFDSVAIAMMWCLYLLGRHPEVQQKAYEEVKSVVEEGDVTYDHLGKLKYLDCVIKETLRLYPPVAFYARKNDKEIQCGKYTIPKGTEIVFCPFAVHRNPNVYPEPQKFDPERFSSAHEVRPWMHVPFAEGYRNCIGKKFAMMEMKVLLVHLLRNLRMWALNEIDDSELDWTMVLKPTKRIRMSFTDRSC